MPKTKTRKLLSLLATTAAATAMTACAGARTTAPAPRAPGATAVVVGAAASPLAELAAPIDTITPLAAGIVVDQPLVGANGRPACGNVQTKSDDSMRDCADLASR